MKKALLVLALLVVLVSPVLAQPECPPKAIELVSFTQKYFWPVGTEIKWETATEVDNVGFNVYRSSTPWGPMFKVNREMIPARDPGGVTGGEYKIVDYYANGFVYWLEDVDVYGVSTFHGPAQDLGRVRIVIVRPRPSIGGFDSER